MYVLVYVCLGVSVWVRLGVDVVFLAMSWQAERDAEREERRTQMEADAYAWLVRVKLRRRLQRPLLPTSATTLTTTTTTARTTTTLTTTTTAIATNATAIATMTSIGGGEAEDGGRQGSAGRACGAAGARRGGAGDGRGGASAVQISNATHVDIYT